MKTSFSALVVCLIITVVMTLFCAHFYPTSSTFSEDIGDPIEQPSIWNVSLFNAEVWLGILTFSITGLPIVLSLTLWVLTAIEVLAIVYLIRGTS